MKDLIIEFKDTGPCKVDVDKVVSAWNDEFSISQWHEEYRLIKHYEDDSISKATISSEQAHQIIGRLRLLKIQDALFVNGKTYRSESNIISEKKRLQKILNKKIQEISVLTSVMNEFDNALLNK